MSTINFNEEHRKQLELLIVSMVISGATIDGFAGTSYTAQDILHNVTLKTIESLYAACNKEISKSEGLSKWSMTNYQQSKIKKLKDTSEFLELAVGWRQLQIEKERDNSRLKELKAKYKELVASTKTPAEQLKEIGEQIKNLGGNPESEE